MRSLSISIWNIQGLYSSTLGLNSTDPEFLINIKHIIVLQETWCRHVNQSGMVETQAQIYKRIAQRMFYDCIKWH